ncbi:hypothetical protein QN379_23200, partial [Glaciimonas sp. Gout2]|uniref:hypothetical protein n=1 Tax=Glaciimonas sp. Gout2 TaxID=3048625 RepID=UPI002B23B8CE
MARIIPAYKFSSVAVNQKKDNKKAGRTRLFNISTNTRSALNQIKRARRSQQQSRQPGRQCAKIQQRRGR